MCLSSIPAPLNGALQAAYLCLEGRRLWSSSSAPRAAQTTTLTASTTSIAGVVLMPRSALSPLLLFLLFYLALPNSNGNLNPTWLANAGASLCLGRAWLAVWGDKSNICSRASPLVTSSTSSTRASRGECRHQIMVWDVVTVVWLSHTQTNSFHQDKRLGCLCQVSPAGKMREAWQPCQEQPLGPVCRERSCGSPLPGAASTCAPVVV